VRIMKSVCARPKIVKSSPNYKVVTNEVNHPYVVEVTRHIH
jgi:hypothetical protein